MTALGENKSLCAVETLADGRKGHLPEKSMERIKADIVVIGGGAAGCFAAIKAREAGADRVVLADKGYVGMSGCSKFAAGSFKAFIPEEDDYDLWFEKAVEEGYFINDQEWTRIHLEEVYHRVKELEGWGVDFIKDRSGKYERLEGQGSSRARPIGTIMFEGPKLMEVLRSVVKRTGVKIMDKTMVVYLLHDRRDPSSIAGALGFDIRRGKEILFETRAVVLSAGAQAFKAHYAYQKMVTGDAHVMGLRAGAEICNYEFTCHHLSCADFDTTGMNVLQGSGARFVNGKGEAYMGKYDPEYGDHASMNRLSAAMACEVMQGNGPIYYEFKDFDRSKLAYFKKTLPLMYGAFERAGYIRDGKIRERIEWVSVNMGNVGYGGGLGVNTKCETNLKGLYAAGDATCGPASGVEGFCAYAIPFASTSGARSGIEAAGYARVCGEVSLDRDEIATYRRELSLPLNRVNGVDPDYILLKVQEALFPMDLYLIRHQDRLQVALERIRHLRHDVVPLLKATDSHHLRMAIEASNMVRCGELFLLAAMERKESRGSHLREDYPEMDNESWLKWVVLKEEDGRITVSTRDIPIDDYPLKPERKKTIHPIARIMKWGRGTA